MARLARMTALPASISSALLYRSTASSHRPSLNAAFPSSFRAETCSAGGTCEALPPSGPDTAPPFGGSEAGLEASLSCPSAQPPLPPRPVWLLSDSCEAMSLQASIPAELPAWAAPPASSSPSLSESSTTTIRRLSFPPPEAELACVLLHPVCSVGSATGTSRLRSTASPLRIPPVPPLVSPVTGASGSPSSPSLSVSTGTLQDRGSAADGGDRTADFGGLDGATGAPSGGPSSRAPAECTGAGVPPSGAGSSASAGFSL
mmetsp:Transcript_23221/g.55573  ORF Transcript_23221/g.55573 Transcript_23221/m.55573 type:complete len:260 (-) Transcript_23221:2981-3760(-)